MSAKRNENSQMNDNGPSARAIIRFRVRAIKDQWAGRKSKYEALQAEGCPYAEHYRDAYEDDGGLEKALRAAGGPKPA